MLYDETINYEKVDYDYDNICKLLCIPLHRYPGMQGYGIVYTNIALCFLVIGIFKKISSMKITFSHFHTDRKDT